MNQLQTKGIVLNRTDFGEADRIVTLLTPSDGKLRLMAKGVRKIKSKLAGGIELFSVSDITLIRGRGDIGTLISARLDTHYGNVIKQIDRVQLGYDLIKLLDKATEDEPEPDYFDLLKNAFEAINDPQIDTLLIRAWFQAQLLKLAGHTPNLHTDTSGRQLATGTAYNFDYDAMAFTRHSNGSYETDHIKALRLLFSSHDPIRLHAITGLSSLLSAIYQLVQTAATNYLNR